MEGNEVTSASTSSDNGIDKTGESPYPIGDWLDKLCSYYMALGVSFDEFWYGDYTRFKYISEANKLKKEAINEQLWLQGLYIDYALSTQFENFGMGLAGKHGKPKRYLEKPIELFPKTEEEKQREDEEERKKLIEFFNSLIAQQERRKKEKADGNSRQS